MKEKSLYITRRVCICNNSVIDNRAVLFSNKNKEENFFQTLYETLDINYPKFFKMDDLCKLGTAAAHILLNRFEKEKYRAEEVGIVLSNHSGSIEADINYYESSKTFPSPSLFVYTLPNIIIGEISIRYGLKGENAFFISDKFDADWICFYVNNLMQNQNIKCCICGWVDVKDQQYDARLFLIEKGKENGVNFTAAGLRDVAK